MSNAYFIIPLHRAAGRRWGEGPEAKRPSSGSSAAPEKESAPDSFHRVRISLATPRDASAPFSSKKRPTHFMGGFTRGSDERAPYKEKINNNIKEESVDYETV